MGVAAWNRGTKIVRQQIEQDYPREACDRRNEREVIRELQLSILKLKDEQERQLNRARRCLAASRAEADRLRQERNELRHERDTLHDTARRYLRAWRKLSAIIRFGLSPKDWHRIREEFENSP